MHSPADAASLSPFEKPRFFEARMALIFAAVILPNGVLAPFFPLWLEKIGFDPAPIAMILSAQMFLRVVTTPVLSSLADRQPDRAPFFVWTVAAALFFSLGYLVSHSFWTVMLVSLSLAVVQPLHTTMSDSLAVSGVRRFRSSYPHMRIWGTIAFLVSNVVGGVVLARYGAWLMPWLYAGAMALALAVCSLTPRLGPPRQRHFAGMGGDTRLLRRPFFVLMVCAVGALQASHAFLYGFSSLYWRALGLDDTVIGILWATGTTAEVIVFALFPRLFGGLSAPLVLALSATSGILRWLLFPVVWPTGLGIAGFFAIQSMHALTTGLLIIGVQKMMAETVPESHTGSAQGIAFFANTLGTGLMTLASGPLYDRWGAHGFWVMALLSTLGLTFALTARRFQLGERTSPGAAIAPLPQPQSAGVVGQTSDPS